MSQYHFPPYRLPYNISAVQANDKKGDLEIQNKA